MPMNLLYECNTVNKLAAALKDRNLANRYVVINSGQRLICFFSVVLLITCWIDN